MRVDIDYLKTQGVSAAAYKKLFTMTPEDRPSGVNRLIEQIRERISAGRDLNLRDYKAYAAIDLAWEAPFNQTTPTIVQSILGKKLNAEQTRNALKAWGLTDDELFMEIDVGNNTKKLVLNPPVFFNLLIPVVKAYVTIRAAKLFNDRNKMPLLPYVPLKQSTEDRVVCEIVTDLIETISTWMGYSATMREGILHGLKYGMALSFPREEWHCEEQVFKDENGNTKTQTLREGIRYVFPHPTRIFFDLQYPLTTINTDTGAEFTGHWEVMKFQDILDNRMYWNRRQITFGTNWFNEPLAKNYFAEAYPCRLEFPVMPTATNNREERFCYYSPNTDRDKAVFVTNYFAKFAPSTFGLANYKYPVWHRFVVAGDDTIIWASPCAYVPNWFMGADYDAQSATQSSMALECIPFQDQLGNVLTQMILTAKQNLATLIYYDTNLVNRTDIDKLNNLGEQKYRGLNFLPFDSLKLQRAGVNQSQAFHVVQLPFRDINPLVQTMSQVLNIMERVMQMSAQEVGAAAQHYQSAEEIRTSNSATTNRLAFSGSFIDDGISAWKQQLYDGAMAYADASILAEVSDDIENLNEIIDKIGFKTESKAKNRISVRGNKKGLQLVGFARNTTDANVQGNMQLAQVIYQTVGVLSGNPEMFQQVGGRNVLKLLEDAARLSGAPNSFKLPLNKDAAPEDIKQWTMQAMQQMQQGMVQSIQENVVQPAAQKAAEHEQQIQQLQGLTQQLTQIFEVAKKQQEASVVKAQEAQAQTAIKAQEAQQASQIKAMEAQTALQIETAKFQSEQAMKQQQHEADLNRKAEAAQVEAAIAMEKAKADIANKTVIAEATATAKKKAAKQEPAKSGK